MKDQTAGTIYDIGYQHYHGERLGRSQTLQTLVIHGVRTIFGFGRGGKAKLIPFILTGMALIPAVLQAWAGALTGNLIQLVGYETYFQQISLVLLLLCAAQAPELVSTDQRNNVLPLYFSRPLRREDYVAGKVMALFVSVFAIALTGQVIILAGRVFANENTIEGLAAESGAVVPIIATAGLAALLVSSIGLAISSFIKARARASAAIIGFILVSAAGTNLLRETLPDPAARYSVLANPLRAMLGVTYWIFDGSPPARSAMGRADLPGAVYLAAVLAFIALALALLTLRYRRMRA